MNDVKTDRGLQLKNKRKENTTLKAKEREKQQLLFEMKQGQERLLSVKAVVCGHGLETLSATFNDAFKGLSSLPILMQESFWW